jgi:hypothetical protein
MSGTLLFIYFYITILMTMQSDEGDSSIIEKTELNFTIYNTSPPSYLHN